MSTTDTQARDPRIGALLRMAHETAERSVVEATVGAGFSDLRPAHFRLLRFPGLEAARPTDLVTRLKTSKQALNPLLRDLERWGYIRLALYADDERGKVIRLTARGRALMSTIWEAHSALEARWEQRVGHRRLDSLQRTLRELAADHPAMEGR